MKNGIIVAGSSIDLSANDTALKNLTLDGQNATFAGEIAVNGNFITLKNFKLPKVTVTTKAKQVNIDAEVKELHVKTRNSKVTLSTNPKIGDLIISREFRQKTSSKTMTT